MGSLTDCPKEIHWEKHWGFQKVIHWDCQTVMHLVTQKDFQMERHLESHWDWKKDIDSQKERLKEHY
jgi:hypothetical protein